MSGCYQYTFPHIKYQMVNKSTVWLILITQLMDVCLHRLSITHASDDSDVECKVRQTLNKPSFLFKLTGETDVPTKENGTTTKKTTKKDSAGKSNRSGTKKPRAKRERKKSFLRRNIRLACSYTRILQSPCYMHIVSLVMRFLC